MFMQRAHAGKTCAACTTALTRIPQSMTSGVGPRIVSSLARQTLFRDGLWGGRLSSSHWIALYAPRVGPVRQDWGLAR